MALIVQEKIPLAPFTTLHIGGEADYLCEVNTTEELKAACQFAKQIEKPLLVLGGGSNVLISDEGFRGLVIINKIKQRDVVRSGGHKILVTLGAGEVFDEIVAWSVEQGWWGLENLSSIPGTIGATPVQNVGAYGVEVSSLITKVVALNSETLKKKVFSKEACCFSYRDSFFKTKAGKKWILTEVTYQLSSMKLPKLAYSDLTTLVSQVDELTSETVRSEIIRIRSNKFPDWIKIGTAGSFFKNPILTNEQHRTLILDYPDLPSFVQTDGGVKVSLGYILDKICGLRGYCEENICLYEKQALVLVALKGATAVEVKNFVKKISTIVFEKIKIKIESEVQIF